MIAAARRAGAAGRSTRGALAGGAGGSGDLASLRSGHKGLAAQPLIEAYGDFFLAISFSVKWCAVERADAGVLEWEFLVVVGHATYRVTRGGAVR